MGTFLMIARLRAFVVGLYSSKKNLLYSFEKVTSAQCSRQNRVLNCIVTVAALQVATLLQCSLSHVIRIDQVCFASTDAAQPAFGDQEKFSSCQVLVDCKAHFRLKNSAQEGGII